MIFMHGSYVENIVASLVHYRVTSRDFRFRRVGAYMSASIGKPEIKYHLLQAQNPGTCKTPQEADDSIKGSCGLSKNRDVVPTHHNTISTQNDH